MARPGYGSELLYIRSGPRSSSSSIGPSSSWGAMRSIRACGVARLRSSGLFHPWCLRCRVGVSDAAMRMASKGALGELVELPNLLGRVLDTGQQRGAVAYVGNHKQWAAALQK